jgi:hypothetical protein
MRLFGDQLHAVNHPLHPVNTLCGLHGNSPLVIVLNLAREGDVPFMARDHNLARRSHPAVLQLLADFLADATVGHGVFPGHDGLLVGVIPHGKSRLEGSLPRQTELSQADG